MRIDAHHHLWDLKAVSYPWLEAKGVSRFFGNPASIQRNYILDEFRQDASIAKAQGSVHIQVGAADGLQEALWVQKVAMSNLDWPLKQVVFCDLTSSNLKNQLDQFQSLSSVVGVRQIVGRAPGEDTATGTQGLLSDRRFVAGLHEVAARGLSFDLQLIPELMEKAGSVLREVSELKVALCHAGSPHDRSPSGLKFYAKELTSLSMNPNVVCKISGLGMFDHDWTAKSVKPFFSACLSQFGAERLMFGSNFPVDSLSSTYHQLVSRHSELIEEISASQRDQFWGGTAERFYGF